MGEQLAIALEEKAFGSSEEQVNKFILCFVDAE
jgi:hypothetical protein